MKTELLIAGLAAFVLSIILGPIVLPILRKLKAGQTVRDDGPEAHLKKTGTPTMGAFIYLIAAMAVLCFFVKKTEGTLCLMLLTLGFAIIGFIDDFIKVVLKRSLGLKAWQKMALQILVSVLFALYVNLQVPGGFDAYIPFAGNKMVNFGWFNIPLCVFILVGTANGSNFTDGVDGLESTVTASIMTFFLAAAIGMGNNIAVVPAVFIGALMGFLMFNVNKALVFMGDTGSLALGGLVAGLAYVLHLELYLPFIALIYFAEVLSVIIQVLYFKATHGKRIFRMAPIHHHFELGGWTEAKVVCVFSAITLVMGALMLIFVPTIKF